MIESLLLITHPSPIYRILPPGLFTELQVNRFGALHGQKVHKVVVHSRPLTASFRMDAFAFFKMMSLKFFPGKLDGTQLFLQSLKNIFLPQLLSRASAGTELSLTLSSLHTLKIC